MFMVRDKLEIEITERISKESLRWWPKNKRKANVIIKDHNKKVQGQKIQHWKNCAALSPGARLSNSNWTTNYHNNIIDFLRLEYGHKVAYWTFSQQIHKVFFVKVPELDVSLPQKL